MEDPEIELLLLESCTDILYCAMPPGVTVKVNIVPNPRLEGVVKAAVVVIVKSDNEAFKVPCAVIVHVIFEPR